MITDTLMVVEHIKLSSKPVYDVLIVGGGLVGASLACALAEVSVRVALLEAGPLTMDHSPSYDDRAIALSHGSTRILDGIGIWPALRESSTPIRRIHVSDRGHFGVTRMDATDHGIDAFGFVTDARRLGIGVRTRLSHFEDIALFSSAEVESVSMENAAARVVVHDETGSRELHTRLLVAADGANSRLRALLGIDVERRDYSQRAITANVTPSLPQPSLAYERFTESGPIALLPMSDSRYGLIWSVREEHAAELMRAGDDNFLNHLQETFGRRLGVFEKCGRRTEFPLTLVKSTQRIGPRLVVVGNAANTLHPIAGQGLNLGLRDVSALAETLVDALRDGNDPGSESVLRQYAHWRTADHRSVTRFTDSLVRLFANRLAPVVMGRNLGLLALDCMPILKDVLVERAMGMAGRQTRLARGLAL